MPVVVASVPEHASGELLGPAAVALALVAAVAVAVDVDDLERAVFLRAALRATLGPEDQRSGAEVGKVRGEAQPARPPDGLDWRSPASRLRRFGSNTIGPVGPVGPVGSVIVAVGGVGLRSSLGEGPARSVTNIAETRTSSPMTPMPPAMALRSTSSR